MAWTEQIGMQSWRVRYRTGDGHIASISGFTTQRAADIECDQRRNTSLGPTPRTHHHRRMGHHLVRRARPRPVHESAHTRWLGSPKTASSARTITLPPFLITMLRKHLERHDNEFVFTAEGGTWLWRSTFIRRVLKPAVNGNEGGPLSGVRTVPIRPGLTFHGLRHSHKTWLIAGGSPEIAQARRLGHHLPNRVTEVYSHVAPEVELRLLNDLQRRWHEADLNVRAHPNAPEPAERHVSDHLPHNRSTAPHTVSDGRTTESGRDPAEPATRSSWRILLQNCSIGSPQHDPQTITEDQPQNSKKPA